MRITLFAAIVLLIGFINSALSEEQEPIYYFGAYGGINFNIHIADFNELPGIPSCCPQYTSGSGTGFSIGGLFEKPLNRAISIGLRFGYMDLGGDLMKNEFIGNTRVNPSNDPLDTFITSVEVEHQIESKLGYLGIEPTVDFKFFRDLYMTAGLNLSYLISGKVNHREILVNPNNVTFTDGRKIRNDVTDRDIPEMNSIHLFGILGMGYQFNLGEKTVLQPELRYYVPFTNISSVNWKVAKLHLGLAIKFPIYGAKELPVINDTTFQRDTVIAYSYDIREASLKLIDEMVSERIDTSDEAIIKTKIYTEKYELMLPKQSNITADMIVTGINKDGVREKVPRIMIEEFETIEMFPLLPYVFFEEKDKDLAKSGLNLINKNESDNNFKDWENAFKGDQNKGKRNSLAIYSEMLNIVASRLKNHPRAIITISGCNNNLSEAGDLALSQGRAEAVKSYLVNNWDIKESRIKTISRNLPDKPGNNTVRDGILENQRAEISSGDYKILEPVTLSDVAKIANPPIVEIDPEIIADSDFKEWDLEIRQGEKLLRSFASSDKEVKYNWVVAEQPLPELEIPVDIILKARDYRGNEAVDKEQIKLEQLTIRKKRFEEIDDKRIERFSLILFDYDKAEINENHRRVIDTIKNSIMPDSKVTIEGFADRTGTPDYNRDLAKRRIEAVQALLKVAPANLVMKPTGSDILIFENDSPQGRGYSRTVRVTIETPIK